MQTESEKTVLAPLYSKEKDRQ